MMILGGYASPPQGACMDGTHVAPCALYYATETYIPIHVTV